jgi:hypothetical protein
MSLRFTATASERKPLPAGMYPARLADVEQREKDGRPFLLWVFAVQTKDGERKLSRPTSTTFGRGSVARDIVEALLGRPMADGETVDADELLDRPCRVVVQVAVDGQGRPVNRITAVLPADEPPF